MIERKERHLSPCTRNIMSYELVDRDGSYHLSVISNVPGEEISEFCLFSSLAATRMFYWLGIVAAWRMPSFNSSTNCSTSFLMMLPWLGANILML